MSDLGVHLIEPCSCECHVRAAVVELVETYATSLAAERARADRLEDALTDALRMALAALAAERAHADRGAQAAQAILYIVRRHCPESPEEDALRDWLDAHDAAREAER